MSLTDALLLDPYRGGNVWIACRTDGSKGSGTASDPYDGSTWQRFDALMNSLPACIKIHLGPGTFQTRGYLAPRDGSHDDDEFGWQPKTGMNIAGSGIDVTTLQLVGTDTAHRHYFVIGHRLATDWDDLGRQVDFFGISDLTIDCNLAAQKSVAAGALRIKGRHARIRRVKVIHWGTKSSDAPCFVISLIAADPEGVDGKISNPGIADCLLVDPAPESIATVTLLHAGVNPESESSEESVGESPHIQNCFLDGGAGNLAKDFRAITIDSCRGGTVEGNQIHNVRSGGPGGTIRGAESLTIRNNIFRNVVYGPHWITGTSVGRLIIERNLIELALQTSAPPNEPVGILLDDGGSSEPPDHVFGNVIIRDNLIRYLEGLPDPALTGIGLDVRGAQNLLIRDNIVECNPTHPIRHKDCGSVKYFNNRTLAGELIFGYDADTQEEPEALEALEDETEGALVLSLFKR